MATTGSCATQLPPVHVQNNTDVCDISSVRRCRCCETRTTGHTDALLTLEHLVYRSYFAIQVILTQAGRLSTSHDRAMLRVDDTIHVAPKKHDLFASTVPKRVELWGANTKIPWVTGHGETTDMRTKQRCYDGFQQSNETVPSKAGLHERRLFRIASASRTFGSTLWTIVGPCRHRRLVLPRGWFWHRPSTRHDASHWHYGNIAPSPHTADLESFAFPVRKTTKPWRLEHRCSHCVVSHGLQQPDFPGSNAARQSPTQRFDTDHT